MSVGSELKSARESKKISLETVSQKTKIPVKYLEALEEDHYDVFPSQTYAKGFIRAYCKVVGLDAQKMTKEFKAQVPEVEVKIEPMNAEAEMERRSPFLGARPAVIRQADAGAETPTVEPEDDLPELHEPIRPHYGVQRSRVKWRSFYSWLGQGALALVLLAVIWFAWQKISPMASKFQWPSFKSASVPAPSTPQASGPVVEDKFQHLVLKGLDKSWVLVTMDDGQSSSEVDLSQGEVRTYQAVKNFKLRLGNAGGVDIQLNGRPLGVLGTTGQVVEITLPVGAEVSDQQENTESGT
jgi:hypothetical protein